MSHLVYILHLAEDHYYVGRVKNPDDFESRLTQHIVGEGAQWTKLHPVEGIHRLIPDASPAEEEAQVIKMAAEHGIEKVRGGTFCTPVLGEAEAKILGRMVDSFKGACFYCHETGHCTGECPLTSSMASKHGGDWECPDCGDLQFARNKECRECGKWRPREYKAAATPTGRKAGDWDCPNPACGDHQFAKNKTCRKCGTGKPAPEEKNESLKRPAPPPSSNDEPATKKPKSNTEPVVRSGDWICSCEAHNYASRAKCFKCGKTRPRADATAVSECCICMDKQGTVALAPCGHTLCETCAPVGNTCPQCRGEVKSRLNIFQ